jgi:uncharacterized membrane protein
VATTVTTTGGDDVKACRLVYYLYLGCVPTLGLSAIAGIAIAHKFRHRGPDWLKTHYLFLIHTFWKGLFYFAIGIITSIAFIGLLILLFTFAFLLWRTLNGLRLLKREEPIPYPRGWLF